MSKETIDNKNLVTVFGKEMDHEAVEFLIRVIGNSLSVVAEHGIKEGWDEERIKAATQSAAAGIAWGFKSLIDRAKGYPKGCGSSDAAP